MKIQIPTIFSSPIRLGPHNHYTSIHVQIVIYPYNLDFCGCLSVNHPVYVAHHFDLWHRNTEIASLSWQEKRSKPVIRLHKIRARKRWKWRNAEFGYSGWWEAIPLVCRTSHDDRTNKFYRTKKEEKNECKNAN